MSDRINDLDNYHELKFSREQGFFDRSSVIRLLIGAFFTLALFLVLHFRETHVEVLELNTIAPNFVVGQIDFEFADDEATAILRQEAVRNLGTIYQVSDKEIEQRRIEFENFLIYNQEWRRYEESNTFEQMFSGVEALARLMKEVRFTDQRTVQSIKESGMPTDFFLVYTPTELSEEIQLPNSVWRFLRNKSLPITEYNNTARALIVGFFKNRTWNVVEDTSMQRALRKRIQSSIPEKYTYVKAGTSIVDRGEKITTRHIAMIQAMKQALNERRNLWHPATLLGSFLLALIFSAMCIAFFYINYPQIFFSNRKLSLVVIVIIITLILAKLTEHFVLTTQMHVSEAIRYPVLVPFAAILLCSLLNSRIATFATGFLTLILVISLVFERQGFMIINVIAALACILSTRTLRRRKEIFVVCLKGWVCCIAVIIALALSQNVLWNKMILSDILSTGVFMLLTAIIVVGLLPLLESTFRVMTNVNMTEYMDPNNDLLQRLTLEAPGTYQHSVVVGSIAEAAAVAIGANGLFCRVATLYHDIGKIVTPQYFTENQEGGMNIHQLLTPQESAAAIIGHVNEGVALARKAGLPEPFIDIIREHHGTTLVYYFYRKELERLQGDKSKINEAEFRYAGPKPRSKESAIIMLADTLEAASRSLQTLDHAHLSELADRIIREKQEDHQFDHSLLTLEELATVKATLIKTILAFGHTRIKYPQRELPKSTPIYDS